MSKIKTFEKDLKPGITLQFIKFLVELAEGFGSYDYVLYQNGIDVDKWNQLIFPLLLHRAVEGLQRIDINYRYEHIYDNITEKNYHFKDYQPCHLTACEMAIMDCLLEVFNETKER